MLHATRRSTASPASVTVVCGLLLTAVTVDAAVAQEVPAPPGAGSAASAKKATKRALGKADPSGLAKRQRASIGSSRASCTRPGPNTRYGSSVFCPNFVAPIYEGGRRSYVVIDTMRTTYSWFVCQALGGANPPFGVGRNHWWLWTQGDDYRRWGWFPANAIKIGGQEQPIPGVRGCY